ncbi:hypothetical protein ACFORL_09390 [Legionella dresdenensis]|uniref:DUF2232 domain-containing protein n=1 Tax=Legionella dresdenensis TaxID=450200 RepID=A0ABV8CGC5_9GAMM
MHRQSQYLLQNERYALFVTAVLAFVPLGAWVSLAIAALVTLRRGWYFGARLTIVSAVSTLIAAGMTVDMFQAAPVILSTLVLVYSGAILLRATESWKITTTVMLFAGLSSIALIHLAAPQYIEQQYQFIVSVISNAGQDDALSQLISEAGINKPALASYMLGVKVFSIIVSALSSLLLARYVQSMLFYPEGFRKEMLAFRASKLGVILLIGVLAGIWQKNAAVVSCLPLIVTYFMAASLSLGFSILKQRRLVSIVLLFAPLIVVPQIMLPVYVFLGSLDSLVNFRLRLPAKAAE